MKTKALLLTSTLFAVWSVQAAERIDPRQLPAPVKSALGASAKDEPVKEITIHNVDGRTVYDVEIERNQGLNPRLRVAADGTVLRDSRRQTGESGAPPFGVYPDYPAPAYIPRVTVEDLPAAARRTIEKEASGREIGEITSDLVDGRPTYRVEFRERGTNPRLFVAENGELIRPPEKAPMLGLGTTFARTPLAVQRTIRREIGEGEITKIDQEGPNGRAAIYKVQMKEKSGTTVELQIGENGKVLGDNRR